ncbi:tetratricopeptide repeat protein [Mangrovivirga cuniculi]|uniref:Tetratricopeptide repeat protein n=1 Tax=Mangrovivirga cuniculi TaxID=2715131 RepID=A0A4D7JJI6_9BACT|nr:tetratricopeptide repeat protein [Mangrovivirga cuniculi]QCK15761.1 hypothetical protein DCC35_13915 [Mangrovivirga cuniculi]
MEYDSEILLIEAYFEDRLTPDEKKEFEQRRLEDFDFQKKVEDYLSIFRSIKESEKEDFQNKLKDWDDEIGSKSKTTKFPAYMKYAAIIILLIIPIGLWQLGYFSNDLSTNEAYITYYSPYEDVITQRNGDQVSLFLEGMEEYNNKNYEKAIEILSSFTAENPQSDMAKIYLGISYLETDENNAAISIFSDLKSNANGLPKELSHWYLAMAYLKTDNIVEAKNLLNSISESDHIFSGKADKLLSRLE